MIAEKYAPKAAFGDNSDEEPPLAGAPNCVGGVCRVEPLDRGQAEENRTEAPAPLLPTLESRERSFPLSPPIFAAENILSNEPANSEPLNSSPLSPEPQKIPISSPSRVDTLPDLQFGEIGAKSPAPGEIVEQPLPEQPLPPQPNTETPNTEAARTLQSAERHQNEPTDFGNPSPFDFVVGPSSSENQSESLTKNLMENQSAVSPEAELHDAIQAAQQPEKSVEAFHRLNDIYRRNGERLSADDLDRLFRVLDRLALEMFYQPSRHLLEPEYTVSAGETLEKIAAVYQVSPELLAAINQLSAAAGEPLPSGTRLKVVRGPVAAEVSFARMELLLTFNGLYAGRFRMGCPERAKTVRGEFTVTRKIPNPEYTGPLGDGRVGHLAGGDPANPLGKYWIELTGGLGLQGTNRPEYVGSTAAPQGGFIFSNRDIEHLNILLVGGSALRIVR